MPAVPKEGTSNSTTSLEGIKKRSSSSPERKSHIPSIDELKKDLLKRLMSIASDGFLQQPFSVEFVEVEAAKPFLGENGEANSMHLIDHAPQVTAIVTLTKDEKFTLLVIVLNRFLQPNQLPKKESLVRACEEQKKKPKKRGCAISGKSTPLIHLH